MGAQPLIHRCDLYRLSLVRRQDAAEGHANYKHHGNVRHQFKTIKHQSA
jgi:hypothetical protein